MTANNFTSGAGTTGGQMIQIPLGLTTSVHSADEFRRLVIRQSGGAVVRLSDVARVELSSDNMQQSVTFGGLNSVFIGVGAVPYGQCARRGDARAGEIRGNRRAVATGAERRYRL